MFILFMLREYYFFGLSVCKFFFCWINSEIIIISNIMYFFFGYQVKILNNLVLFFGDFFDILVVRM